MISLNYTVVNSTTQLVYHDLTQRVGVSLPYVTRPKGWMELTRLDTESDMFYYSIYSHGFRYMMSCCSCCSWETTGVGCYCGQVALYSWQLSTNHCQPKWMVDSDWLRRLEGALSHKRCYIKFLARCPDCYRKSWLSSNWKNWENTSVCLLILLWAKIGNYITT